METVDYNRKFNNYYFNYLGISEKEIKAKKAVFPCIQRDIPLNNDFLYKLIITNLKGNNIFSISPSLYNAFKKYTKSFKTLNTDELSINIKNFCDHNFKNYVIKNMYRMTLEHPKEYVLPNKVKKLTKEILMENTKSFSTYEKEKIWLRKKKEIIEGRQYVILDKNRIVSYCKISNIDFQGGNIVVYTNEQYRNRGYGKLVTTGILNWCVKNNVLPIYLVDEKNTFSIKLAESLGFKIKSKEIVISYFI